MRCTVCADVSVESGPEMGDGPHQPRDASRAKLLNPAVLASDFRLFRCIALAITISGSLLVLHLVVQPKSVTKPISRNGEYRRSSDAL